MKHTGNLVINALNAAEYSGLVEVTGDLRVYGKARLPVLATVGGDLRVYSEASLTAPVLATVGGEDVSGGKCKIFRVGKWSAFATPTKLSIGCQGRTWEKWLEMSDDEIDGLDGDALAEAQAHREMLVNLMIELRGAK